MEAYLRQHEAFIRRQLAAGEGVDWAALGRLHGARIEYLQHERLVHLLVTLFFGACALGALLFTVVRPQMAVNALLLLILALLVPYVFHYYRLENGVQRWYLLADEIERRRGAVPAGDGDGPDERRHG